MKFLNIDFGMEMNSTPDVYYESTKRLQVASPCPFANLDGIGSCHGLGVAVGLCGYGMCQCAGQFEGESI